MCLITRVFKNCRFYTNSMIAVFKQTHISRFRDILDKWLALHLNQYAMCFISFYKITICIVLTCLIVCFDSLHLSQQCSVILARVFVSYNQWIKSPAQGHNTASRLRLELTCLGNTHCYFREREGDSRYSLLSHALSLSLSVPRPLQPLCHCQFFNRGEVAVQSQALGTGA